jgi:hypothetical protein
VYVGNWTGSGAADAEVGTMVSCKVRFLVVEFVGKRMMKDILDTEVAS